MCRTLPGKKIRNILTVPAGLFTCSLRNRNHNLLWSWPYVLPLFAQESFFLNYCGFFYERRHKLSIVSEFVVAVSLGTRIYSLLQLRFRCVLCVCVCVCGIRGASVSNATSVYVFGICAKLSLMNCLISEL